MVISGICVGAWVFVLLVLLVRLLAFFADLVLFTFHFLLLFFCSFFTFSLFFFSLGL